MYCTSHLMKRNQRKRSYLPNVFALFRCHQNFVRNIYMVFMMQKFLLFIGKTIRIFLHKVIKRRFICSALHKEWQRIGELIKFKFTRSFILHNLFMWYLNIKYKNGALFYDLDISASILISMHLFACLRSNWFSIKLKSNKSWDL